MAWLLQLFCGSRKQYLEDRRKLFIDSESNHSTHWNWVICPRSWWRSGKGACTPFWKNIGLHSAGTDLCMIEPEICVCLTSTLKMSVISWGYRQKSTWKFLKRTVQLCLTSLFSICMFLFQSGVFHFLVDLNCAVYLISSLVLFNSCHTKTQFRYFSIKLCNPTTCNTSSLNGSEFRANWRPGAWK